MKIYSSDDVRQMVADGRLLMGNLPGRRLNQRQVVIETQNKAGVDVLNAPDRYADDGLVNTLLHSFTLPDYVVKVSIGEKQTRNLTIKLFFAFLDSRDYPTTSHDEYGKIVHSPLPAHCFSDWQVHLKATASDMASWKHMWILLKVLRRTLVKFYGKTSDWPPAQKAAWQVLNACTPRRPSNEKSPPLGIYLGIPSTEFTNRELQMGLRYGVIWLLQRLQAQRSAFVAEPVIEESLRKLHGSARKTYRHALKDLYAFAQKKALTEYTDNEEQLARIAPASWRIIQGDPLLTEWQCYSFTKLRPALVPDTKGNYQLIAANVQQLLLSRCVNQDGSLRQSTKGFGRNDHDWAPLKSWLGPARGVKVPQPCRWGLNWLMHSKLEQLLMVWLLASERAQSSGIANLRFSEVHVARRELQISTLKLRRSANASAKLRRNDVETSIYRLNGAVGEVYHTWLQQAQKAQAAISQLNPEKKYFYGSAAELSGAIVSNTNREASLNMLPLELLSIPGTVWHNTFLEESEDIREAQAFVAILANRIAANRANPKKKIALPPGPIGQSLVVEQELENNNDETYSSVENEAVGHTENTGRNVYKDGFARLGVSEILEPVRAFARKVGDGKIKLAQLMAERLDQESRPVTLLELEQLCGVTSARSDQRDLLARLDVQDKITITGELNVGDQLLVVQTDLTAAMMWGYIRHLEAQLPELMGSNRDQTTVRHLAQYLHLSETWGRFDNSLQQAGKQLANEMQFPFPPLN